jgi:uncharacterized membrane protein
MPFFKFKAEAFLTKEEAATVVAAIRNAESLTSGEIRVYLETKNKYVNPMDRAKEVFNELDMEKTALRNGVLVYVATQDKEIVVLGDKGIYEILPSQTWNDIVKQLANNFAKKNHVQGLVIAVTQISEILHQHFPYDEKVDKNELPDEIIFGK